MAYHVVALYTLGETQLKRFQDLLHLEGLDQPYWRALPLAVYDFLCEYTRDAFRMLRDGKNIVLWRREKLAQWGGAEGGARTW